MIAPALFVLFAAVAMVLTCAALGILAHRTADNVARRMNSRPQASLQLGDMALLLSGAFACAMIALVAAAAA